MDGCSDSAGARGSDRQRKGGLDEGGGGGRAWGIHPMNIVCWMPRNTFEGDGKTQSLEAGHPVSPNYNALQLGGGSSWNRVGWLLG